MADITFIEALDWATGADQATVLFEQTYGSSPDGVWSAPGRVNLIGEHTDYNAGLCLPIALPHRTYIALRQRDDSQARVVSALDPSALVATDLDTLTAGGVTGWAAYPLGVAWALRERAEQAGRVCLAHSGAGSCSQGPNVRGFDAAFVSCVPDGAGLSSSASLTCSTALALDAANGLGFGGTDAGRVELAQAAIRAENEMAGAATGGMDQAASLRCQAGHALLLDCRPELSPLANVSQQPFDLVAHGLELLVIDTQAPHRLNDGQYAARRATCEQAAALLGVASLRVSADAVAAADDPAAALGELLDRLPDELMRKRVRHVVTEIERVRQFVKAFADGDIATAGSLMNASHDSLAFDYEVTVPELDQAVRVARGCGAYGARMTGGGFGGSVIALVDAGRSQEVAAAVATEFARLGFRPPRALAAYAAPAASRDR